MISKIIKHISTIMILIFYDSIHFKSDKFDNINK
jgi:hypothetical protein